MNTPNLNLAQLTQLFGTDEKCRKALEQLRWAEGAKCPRCKAEATAIANRFQYDCNECHYQFSVTAGTIFHDSHLPLWKWFMVTALLCEAKKGMSACQIQRTVGEVRFNNLSYRRSLGILGANEPQIAVALPNADYNLLEVTLKLS